MDKFRYHIYADRTYLIQVGNETKEVLGKELLNAYLTYVIFDTPRDSDTA